MTKKIIIDATATISEGDTMVVYSTTGRVNEKVTIHRGYKGAEGNAIASGRITRRGDKLPGAPVTPTSGGKKKNAWRHYREVLIERILK